eukprot:3869276-Pyramimonas_sp.AAC.1
MCIRDRHHPEHLALVGGSGKGAPLLRSSRATTRAPATARHLERPRHLPICVRHPLGALAPAAHNAAASTDAE